jgi:hypothetical protein
MKGPGHGPVMLDTLPFAMMMFLNRCQYMAVGAAGRRIARARHAANASRVPRWGAPASHEASPQPARLRGYRSLSRPCNGSIQHSARRGLAPTKRSEQKPLDRPRAEKSPGPCRTLPPACLTRPLGGFDDTACTESASRRDRCALYGSPAPTCPFTGRHRSCHWEPAGAVWCEVIWVVPVVGCDSLCIDAKQGPGLGHGIIRRAQTQTWARSDVIHLRFHVEIPHLGKMYDAI